MCWKIVSKTPESKLIDWKLVYRDPLPNWVSGYGSAPGHGRICLLGDAAHPFLPTSEFFLLLHLGQGRYVGDGISD
jgi:hypothetical protein